MKSDPSCASCGKPFIAHLGVIGTCAELIKTQKALDAALTLINSIILDGLGSASVARDARLMDEQLAARTSEQG